MMKLLGNKVKTEKGITLVALVITIIILIILARSINECYNSEKMV